MASDVLQDLMRALCSLSIVRMPFEESSTDGRSAPTRRGSTPMTDRRESAARETT